MRIGGLGKAFFTLTLKRLNAAISLSCFSCSVLASLVIHSDPIDRLMPQAISVISTTVRLQGVFPPVEIWVVVPSLSPFTFWTGLHLLLQCRAADPCGCQDLPPDQAADEVLLDGRQFHCRQRFEHATHHVHVGKPLSKKRHEVLPESIVGQLIYGVP